MKIAIPTENGRMHEHFGGCREFAFVELDLDQKRVLRREILAAPEHQPGLFPRWLREQGVQVIIAGGIGHRALANCAHFGIAVRSGIPNAGLDELVAAYLDERLLDPPTGCDHGEHGHHDHDHHHHHRSG